MKTTSLALVLASAFLALAPISAQVPPGTSRGPDLVNVSVGSEAKDLAKGFEKAFTGMGRPPISLVMIKDGKTFVLEDIGRVKAEEGVLRVEVGKGLTYILNARDVLCITDGKVPVGQ